MTDETLPRSPEELEDLASYYAEHDVSEEIEQGHVVSAPMVTTSLRLPKPVVEILKADAARRGVPYTKFVRDILIERSGVKDALQRTRTVVRSGKKAIHVVPAEGRRGWRVVREGQKRAIARADTQAEAAEKGRSVARRDKVEFTLHRKDGTVREKHSYETDSQHAG